MKVIFLDFDGVLNTKNYQEQFYREGKPQWDDFCHVFDPEAVENLKMILDAVPEPYRRHKAGRFHNEDNRRRAFIFERKAPVCHTYYGNSR